MKRIYLDNAATTPMLPAVKKTMLLSLETFGNASSMHDEGRKARKILEEAREVIASCIGAEAEEIIFTSGGSESNNMVLNTFAGKKIAVSAIEHPSVLVPAKKYDAKIIPVNKKGRVDLRAFEDIAKKANFISVMMANNEIGTIQDIKKLAKIAHKNGALFHTDASQALGKIPIDVKELEVDYLTMSAHKIGAPRSIGALFVAKKAPINSLIIGGNQENGCRAGTENAQAALSFGKAVESYDFSQKHDLVAKLRDGIIESIPNTIINGDQKNCLPNILNVTFAGVEGESILLRLDAAGISVSTGSACAASDIKSSHVLTAIGADPEKAHGSVRFSFGPNNTIREVDIVLRILPGIISDLRKMSTIGGKYE